MGAVPLRLRHRVFAVPKKFRHIADVLTLSQDGTFRKQDGSEAVKAAGK